MAEELQHLLKRIRTEAVEKSELEANEILTQARRKAAVIVREAEEEAKRRLQQADERATAYLEKSTRSLEQAGRDLLITIGESTQRILDEIVASTVARAMDDAFLKSLLDRAVAAYLQQADASGGIEVWLGPDEQDQLKRYFLDKYRDTVTGGLTIHTDPEMTKGFRVSFDGTGAFHDFSAEAVADSLTRFLRPHLAEMIQRAATSGSTQEDQGAS